VLHNTLTQPSKAALNSPEYCDKAPFKLNGMIEQVHVMYVAAKYGMKPGWCDPNSLYVRIEDWT
jgi:hypothetical protein